MSVATHLSLFGIYAVLVASVFAAHFTAHAKIPRGAAVTTPRLRTPIGSPGLVAVRRAVGFATLVAFLSPVLAVVAFGCVVASTLSRRQHQARSERALLAAATAEAIDLFGVMLHAGHAIPSCVHQAGQWLDGYLGATCRWCDDQTRLGMRVADALEEVPERLGANGAVVRPLIAALVANERYGAPIAQGLAQMAADTRADQRRQAEAVARRLPVSLLFPLVACVLPAFMLLTVVPALGETLWSLELFASPNPSRST